MIINFSVPPIIGQQINRLAKQQNKTKSELLREAFRVYNFQIAWAQIKLWGEETTSKMGLETYDDIEKIAGWDWF